MKTAVHYITEFLSCFLLICGTIVYCSAGYQENLAKKTDAKVSAIGMLVVAYGLTQADKQPPTE
jgi:glycerol uptake facilitator-like aquaporin